MIKFFRKIRQNLLIKNKTGKYFKYAIGEIVLVVIGILIALNVNNYNEIAPIMTSFSFDFVYHYAAVVGVLRTLDNPVMVLDDIQGIKNILDLSKSTGVKRVFFSSSSN